MDKLNPISIGVSAGITAAVVSALCAAVFVFWLDATIEFFNSWIYGLDLNKARSSAPLTVGRVLYGVIAVAIIGFVSPSSRRCTIC
jgi:small-conductance mechanosensitive channel